METKELLIKRLSIHPEAETTPSYNQLQFQALIDDIESKGQLTPIIVFKNEIIDGRHRFLAFKELGLETITANILPPNTTNKEIESMVESAETRRHETPAQLAIKAWYYYMKPENNVTMNDVSRKFGASIANIKRANKIGGSKNKHYKRPDILDLLFSGHKFPIENHLTDSLASIENFLAKQALDRKTKLTGVTLNTDELSESEEELVDAIVLKVGNEATRVQKAIASRLYYLANKE